MNELPHPPVEEDPFQKEVQTFWSEVGKDLVRGSIKTIDETAKQIIAVSGILEGLYFHAIAFSDLRGQVSGPPLLIYLAPIVLLMVSLGAALFVFLPERYPLDVRAWRASKLVYERVKKSKYRLLWIAAVTLMLGVLAILFAVVTYLTG